MRIGTGAKRPWLPFHGGEFFSKANLLSDAQGMALLRLLWSYWENGGLPNNDDKLARIARMTPKQWNKSKAAIAEYFGEGWVSERLDLELAKIIELSNKNSEKALLRHSRGKAAVEPEQEPGQSHLHEHLQSRGMERSSRAHEESSLAEADALCVAFKTACGIRREKDAPQDWGDVRSRAIRWVGMGYSTSMIVAEARAVVARTGEIKPLNYFEEAFATAVRQAARPLPPNGVSDVQRF